MKYAAMLLALASFGASAQMVDDPVCYTWNGGNFSAGSFSKCGPVWTTPRITPKVVVTPVPPPAPVIQQSPIMMPMTAPPKPVVKRKPKPKLICKPA